MVEPVDNTACGAVNYNAFNYALEDLTPLLPAPISPNVIATATIAQAFRVQPEITSNSSYAFIDLQSLRYACVYADQVQAHIAQTCTIQISGVKYDTGATVIQELIFNPVAGVNQFGSASFPAFTRVKQVNLHLIQATSGQVLGVSLLGHIAYKA